MFWRFAAFISLITAVTLAAQSASSQTAGDADDNDAGARIATLSVHASPRGNVTVSATIDESFEDAAPVVLNTIPAALGCDWVPTARDKFSVTGICRGWLLNSPLRLAPAVEGLYALGADVVWINLDAPRNVSAQPPPGWEVTAIRRGKPSYFTFNSSHGKLPGDFPIAVDGALTYSRVFVPIFIMLLIPGPLAFAIRVRAMRAAATAEQKVNWIVWMNWISLCSWLYWISSVNLSDLGEMLQLLGFSHIFIPLLLGVAIYALPPLFAAAACMVAMAPLLSSSPASLQLLLKRRLAAEAVILVPLGIFLVSAELNSSSFGYGTASLGLVAAYVVYRALAWLAWTLSYSERTELESGELFESASALAKKAGVPLAGLSLLRTRVPEEANAFASAGNKITLTESLVKGLTRREVEAVIAHELGHHKAGHTRVNYGNLLFIAYFLFAGPLFGWLISTYHLPQWFVTLPITPLLLTMLQGVLSQRREFSADARAAEITGDPEGAIAALARLAQLSRIPVQNQGIMGSILSHPSMEKRVLTLARLHAIPDERALEILRDPNVIYAGALIDRRQPSVEPTVVLPPEVDPVFNLRAKMALHEQLRWFRLISPLAGACILAIPLVLLPFYPAPRAMRWLTLLAVLPILAFQIVSEYAVLRLFAMRIRRRIAQKINPQPGAIFVGIHPRDGVRYTDGLTEWDFGFITIDGDWLCYRGEKTRFAIPRQSVNHIRIVKGCKTWLREHRVEVASAQGWFTLNTNFAYATLAETERTANRLCKWAAGAGGFTAGVAPEPPPSLPQLPGMQSSRLGAIWMAMKITAQLWIAAALIVSVALRNGSFTAVSALAIFMFSAPLAVFVRLLPLMLWPIRPPSDDNSAPAPAPVPSSAPATVQFKP